MIRTAVEWCAYRREPTTFPGYDNGRPIIYRQQHHKCAYCEAPIGISDDIDHHRPKEHYWWLGWSWQNLLQTCATCHGKKGTRYLGAPLLRPLEIPPGVERDACRPVDPARDEPREHIRFKLEWVDGRYRWEPYGITERGAWTIELVGLDDKHLGNLQKHADSMLGPGKILDTIKKDVAANRLDAAERYWRAEIANRLSPGQAYRSLSFEVLVHFRRRIQRQYRHRLPPLWPFDAGPPAPDHPPLIEDTPELRHGPPLTGLYIRLCRRSGIATEEHRRDALVAVLREGPQTRSQLADLFQTKPATVHRWIKPLIPAQIESEGRGATTIYRLPQDP